MNLTDEQREEIESVIKHIESDKEINGTNEIVYVRSRNGEHKVYCTSFLTTSIADLLSSEQAWREEARKHRERWQHELETSDQVVQEREELIVENEALRVQLKQSVNAIERSINLLQEDYFENWDEAVNVLAACLSSLSQEGEKEQITLRPELQWFAEQMELALQENEHKAHWSQCSVDYLLEQLYRNADKIKDGYRVQRSVNVANHAMMIANNSLSQGTEE